MTTLDAYRAHDARVAIGLPVKQDTGEYEYPASIDGVLIAFFPNIRTARLALENIIDVGAFVAPDVEFAPVGWAE